MAVLTSCSSIEEKPFGEAEHTQFTSYLLLARPWQVDILGIKPNPRLEYLVTTWGRNVQLQRAWFDAFLAENHTPGERIPYHPNFGLSEEEYSEMLTLNEGVEIEPVGTGRLEIKRDGDELTFQGAASLSVFDDLTFNTQTGLFSFRGETLELTGPMARQESDWGLKAKLFGYSWEFHEPEIIDGQEQITPVPSMKSTRVTVAKMGTTGQTYLHLEVSATRDGVPTENQNHQIAFR